MTDYTYVDDGRWQGKGRPRTYKLINGKYYYTDWPNNITDWREFVAYELKNPNWHKNAEWKPE